MRARSNRSSQTGTDWLFHILVSAGRQHNDAQSSALRESSFDRSHLTVMTGIADPAKNQFVYPIRIVA